MPEMLTSIRVSSINIKPVDHHQAPSLQVRLEQLDKQHLQVLWTTDVVCSVPRLMFSSFAAFFLGEQTFHRTSISIALRELEQLTLKVCYCSFRKAMPVIGSNFIIYPACRHNCNDSCNFAEALHGMCMLPCPSRRFASWYRCVSFHGWENPQTKFVLFHCHV